MKFKEFIKSQVEGYKALFRFKCERFVIWAIERVLQNQAIAISFAFKGVMDRADQFESAARQVSDVYTQSILNLDARLKALESREQ